LPLSDGRSTLGNEPDALIMGEFSSPTRTASAILGNRSVKSVPYRVARLFARAFVVALAS